MKDTQTVLSLIGELTELRTEMLRQEAALEDRLREICDLHRESARNLLHYIALRRHDIRDLQEVLTAEGLSSLGRAEADVLGAFDAVLRVLHRLAGDQEFASNPKTLPKARAFAIWICWSAIPMHCSVRRRRAGTCASWLPCRQKRPMTSDGCATCSSAA